MPRTKKRIATRKGAASKKNQMLSSKKQGKVSELDDEMINLLKEVSKKLDSGPRPKDIPTRSTLNKVSRANSMKTNLNSSKRGRSLNNSKAKKGRSNNEQSTISRSIVKKKGLANKPNSKILENEDGDDYENEQESDDEDEYESEEENFDSEDEDGDESESDSEDEESEWEESNKKELKPKPKSRKTKRNGGSNKHGKNKKQKVSKPMIEQEYDDESTTEDEEDESDSELMSDDNDYTPSKGMRNTKPMKKKRGKLTKKRTVVSVSHPKVVAQKEKIPPVGEMVVDSIKALGANPKKGSNLRSIKSTILLNWPINMKMYIKKIKKFMNNAIESGDITRVKGNGFNGRFTVPGLKMKKKRKTKKLGKKFDEDDEEYAPRRTQRDDEREENKVSVEIEREKRKAKEEKLLKQKESRPKKKVSRKLEWEVEAIRGIKDRDDERYYLVKWKGYSKPNWEPEQNVQDCDKLIEAYLDAAKTKEQEQAKWKRLAAKGTFEPDRILDVRVSKGKRQFLIRWKGHGSESDQWEMENDLNCKLMIEKFLFNHEKDLQRTNSTREMREAPKQLDRFVFARSKRVAKRKGGLGISYAGMDGN